MRKPRETLAGVAIFLAGLLPRTLLKWLGLSSVPDDLSKWRALMSWALAHLPNIGLLLVGMVILLHAQWQWIVAQKRLIRELTAQYPP